MSEFKLLVQDAPPRATAPARTTKPARDPRATPRPASTDALYLFQELSEEARLKIRRAVVRAVLGRSGGGLMDALGGDYNHPALVAAIRSWWPTAGAIDVIYTIGPERSSLRGSKESLWLAVALAVEGQPNRLLQMGEPELLVMMKSFVRGELSAEDIYDRIPDLDAILPAIRHVVVGSVEERLKPLDFLISFGGTVEWINNAPAIADLGVGLDNYVIAAVYAKVRAAIAAGLRELYPDPLRIDAREALTRYDAAVAKTRAAMPLVADLDREVRDAMAMIEAGTSR